jgi:uncharacterized protein involved in exopolysaccharide biosynthesis
LKQLAGVPNVADKFFSDDASSTPLVFQSYSQKYWLNYFQKNQRLGLTVGAFLLAAALTYGLVGYKPNYNSSATVLIKDAAMEARYVVQDSGPSPAAATSNTTNPLLNTLGLLKTDSIRDALYFYFTTQHPEVLEKKRIHDHSKWNEFFGNGKKFINAKNQAGTDFISVSFKWPDAVIAKEALEVTLDALKNASRQLNQAEQHERVDYLNQQIADVRLRLEAARGRIRSFKQQSRLVDINNEREGYARNRIEMETLLAGVSSDATSKQNEMRSYERLLGMSSRQAVSATALGGNENVNKMQSQLYSLKEEYKSLRVRYTDEHPKMIQLRADMSQVEKNLNQEASRTLGYNATTSSSAAILDKPRGDAVTNLLSAKAQADSLNAKAGAIRQHLSRLDTKLNQLPELEKTLSDLRDEENILSDSLRSLEQKALEAKIREMQTLSNVFVVENPSVPYKANFPERVHMIWLGVLASVIGGLGSILLKHKLEEKRQVAAMMPNHPVRSENGSLSEYSRFAQID